MAEIPPLVHVIGDHSVRLLFQDGTVGDVTFGDEEWTGVFEPLRDPARFANVKVEGGTIVWPDDALDMGPRTALPGRSRACAARASGPR